MRALLICPADRPSAAFLSRRAPLALMPVLGRSLLDLWMAELASRGAREVLVLATDRPEEIRRILRKGEPWGLRAEVVPESRELAVDEARAKYQALNSRATGPPANWLPAPHDLVVLDHLPTGTPLWSDPASWFRALLEAIPSAPPQRVGYRELSPGVWIHVRAQIAAGAHLEGPCWIGSHASVGARSRVGPGTIIEDGAYVDDGAEVVHSFVGPATYVGAMTELRESLAWGRSLFKWSTGSLTEVTDGFLLGELGSQRAHKRPTSIPGRLAALLALFLCSPLALVAGLRRRAGEPWLISRQAVRAPIRDAQCLETCIYHELAGLPAPWRRWPELWRIARGDFAWVGNRPLTREQAADLQNDFERLWLAVPTGLVSLGDAEQSGDAFGDEARAHASFYAVRNDRWSDLRILWRVFGRAAPRSSPRIAVEVTPQSQS